MKILQIILHQFPCCALSGNQGQCNHVGVSMWAGREQLLRREFPGLTMAEVETLLQAGKILEGMGQ